MELIKYQIVIDETQRDLIEKALKHYLPELSGEAFVEAELLSGMVERDVLDTDAEDGINDLTA